MKIQLKTLSLLLFSIFLASALFAAEATSLYDDWSRKGQVKIHVSEFRPLEGKKADAAGLKTELEKALANRKSIRFAIVPNQADADLVVAGEILDFYWTDHDPVDMLMGGGSAAYDASTIENYARMDASLAVSDKNGRKLWEDKLGATITSKTLTEAESPAKINEDMAKVFVSAAFGKKRTR